MKKNSYILLLDQSEQMLTFQEAVLNASYPGKVFKSSHPDRAAQIVSDHGSPEFIILESRFISDKSSSLYRLLSEEYLAPLIVTSEEQEEKLSRLPAVAAVAQKPVTAGALVSIVDSLLNSGEDHPAYIPVKISLLLSHGTGAFSLYLKLSETNFIKFLHAEEAFCEVEEKKLREKGISELFVKFEEREELFRFLEKNLLGTETVEEVNFVLDSIESFERVARTLNWSPEIIVSAHKTVEQAVKILGKNKNLIHVLKKRLEVPSSPYSRHVVLLTYLVSAMGAAIPSIGEAGQVKLALAALVHDLSVDEKCYHDIDSWNKRASDFSLKDPETVKYRLHPYEATKILEKVEFLPPDVAQIVLQHHEIKDGTGFPRSLIASNISRLSSLFIIVEDLLDFLAEGKDVENSITDFLTWGQEFYKEGHFEKIFNEIRKTCLS